MRFKPLPSGDRTSAQPLPVVGDTLRAIGWDPKGEFKALPTPINHCDLPDIPKGWVRVPPTDGGEKSVYQKGWKFYHPTAKVWVRCVTLVGREVDPRYVVIRPTAEASDAPEDRA